MIGYIKGIVKWFNATSCIIDVQGVGYELICSQKVLQSLILDQEFAAFVYTHVREDQFKLFGFSTASEKELFETLIGISGIGPKIAISIFSVASEQMIKEAIIKADVNFFTQIKGLGKKNAQKIIIELKSKIGSTAELDLNQNDELYAEDVVLALQSFGFIKKDIFRILKTIDSTLPEPQQIKLALQQLGKQ